MQLIYFIADIKLSLFILPHIPKNFFLEPKSDILRYQKISVYNHPEEEAFYLIETRILHLL